MVKTCKAETLGVRGYELGVMSYEFVSSAGKPCRYLEKRIDKQKD
jgi:hypothetical protein